MIPLSSPFLPNIRLPPFVPSPLKSNSAIHLCYPPNLSRSPDKNRPGHQDDLNALSSSQLPLDRLGWATRNAVTAMDRAGISHTNCPYKFPIQIPQSRPYKYPILIVHTNSAQASCPPWQITAPVNHIPTPTPLLATLLPPPSAMTYSARLPMRWWRNMG